jgi:serine/threonine protein kinase
VIADFGMSIDREELLSKKAFYYCGTPGYIPPEMLDDLRCEKTGRIKKYQNVYDERVDIWCLGIILHYLLYQG